MDSVLLMAAIGMGTLVVDTQQNANLAPQQADPAPKKADLVPKKADSAPKNADSAPQQFDSFPVVNPAAEYIYPLPVPPKIYSRYANLNGGLPAGVPCKRVRKQTAFPGRALIIFRLPPDAAVYFNWYYLQSDS